jgi:hypothetical protein
MSAELRTYRRIGHERPFRVGDGHDVACPQAVRQVGDNRRHTALGLLTAASTVSAKPSWLPMLGGAAAWS